MVPAFLSAYTSSGGGKLDIFPSLARMLPNWTIRYSGLGKLPFLRDIFKSVNITHAYRSIFAIGSYSSYSTFMEYMNGLGFIENTTSGSPMPSSMYNVSTVSLNESFSPLLGVDVTLNNNLTAKLEYRSTRVLSLSMTSVQLNEATSHDWVLGAGYKLTNFNLFGSGNHRKVKSSKKGGDDAKNQNNSKNGRNSNTTGRDLNLRHRLYDQFGQFGQHGFQTQFHSRLYPLPHVDHELLLRHAEEYAIALKQQLSHNDPRFRLQHEVLAYPLSSYSLTETQGTRFTTTHVSFSPMPRRSGNVSLCFPYICLFPNYFVILQSFYETYISTQLHHSG